MVRPKSKVEAGLQNKGFKKTEGDHHYFVYTTLDGKVTGVAQMKDESRKSRK
jgi:hypothetical protein